MIRSIKAVTPADTGDTEKGVTSLVICAASSNDKVWKKAIACLQIKFAEKTLLLQYNVHTTKYFF